MNNNPEQHHLCKVIFLLNHNSDQELLFDLMQESVNTLPRNSVNYSEGEIKIQFFMYTGGIKQLENESGQAWKQRINLQLLDKN